MILMVSFVLGLVFVLLGVAFYTLLERKVLSYIHERLGPNKVFIAGVLQPMGDAISLFMKFNFKMNLVSFFFYYVLPFLGLVLMLMVWFVFPFFSLGYMFFSMLILFCLSSLGVYYVVMCGWMIFSKYSMFGSYRSSSQSISYEVIMILCLLYYGVYMMNLSSFFYLIMQSNLVYFVTMNLSVLLMWFLVSLAETNRSPFDFMEGESELVSGFNTEYGGGLFSMIFIGEYASILFFSMISGIMFLGNFYFFMGIFFMFLFLWVRGSFPRMRYDHLMMFCWSGLMFFFVGYIFFMFLGLL